MGARAARREAGEGCHVLDEERSGQEGRRPSLPPAIGEASRLDRHEDRSEQRHDREAVELAVRARGQDRHGIREEEKRRPERRLPGAAEAKGDREDERRRGGVGGRREEAEQEDEARGIRPGERPEPGDRVGPDGAVVVALGRGVEMFRPESTASAAIRNESVS